MSEILRRLLSDINDKFELAKYPPDIAKSAASGAARGIMALNGFPGDIANLVSSSAGYGQTKIPATNDFRSAFETIAGKLYEPQTTPGQYAETIGTFAPSAVLVPYGGILGNLMRYGVMAGGASEAAGQATKGTSYELPARIGAGVLTGGVLGAMHEGIGGGGLMRLIAQNADEIPDALVMANSQSNRK